MASATGSDESHFKPAPPDAVLFAESTDDVVRCLEICSEFRCPVIPYGAGSSLEGHVMAIHGGVSLDLSRMDRIQELNADDLDCRVEAGVTRKQLNRLAAEHGLAANECRGRFAPAGFGRLRRVACRDLRRSNRGLVLAQQPAEEMSHVRSGTGNTKFRAAGS